MVGGNVGFDMTLGETKKKEVWVHGTGKISSFLNPSVESLTQYWLNSHLSNRSYRGAYACIVSLLAQSLEKKLLSQQNVHSVLICLDLISLETLLI